MNSRSRIVAGGISLLIYLVIYMLSSLPASSLPAHIPDFIPHFLEYFALAFFFIQVFPKPGRGRTMPFAFVLLAVLGILDEWHQMSAPGRVFSLLDWAYDILGSLAGLAAFRFLDQWSIRNSGREITRRLGIFLLHR